jgi:uncharacterized Zn finger protein (UPF0148 family)
MAHTCSRCGDPATTLTDDGELLCDDCDDRDSGGISSPADTTTITRGVGL